MAEKAGEFLADLAPRLAQCQAHIHAGAGPGVADRAVAQPLFFECDHGADGAVRDFEGMAGETACPVAACGAGCTTASGTGCNRNSL